MLIAQARMRTGSQAGVTILEVLVTIVILAFGVLGLAGLQVRVQAMEFESYQRAQAILLLSDMVERLQANSGSAVSYVSAGGSSYGTGDNQPASCAGIAARAERDVCEWSNALKGAAESSGGSVVGAMIGARGCVEQLQAPNPGAGVCTPGVYRVSVAWQGLQATTVPNQACGAGNYGASDAQRRALSTNVTVALPDCV